MSDITYEHIKAIAKLEKEIKQLKEKETTSDLFIAKLSEENQRLKSSMKTLLQAWQRGDSYEFYEDLIEKHKLLEP